MTASAKGTVEEPGKNVAQKSGLNRVILDLAHGQFREILKRKVLAAGGTFVLVDPRNTSRRCNPCGHVSAESRKSQAVFECVACGHEANADHNASRNIRDRAFGAPQNPRPQPEDFRGWPVNRAGPPAGSRNELLPRPYGPPQRKPGPSGPGAVT
jgi:putative transposase